MTTNLHQDHIVTTPLQELTAVTEAGTRFGQGCATLAALCEKFPPVEFSENDGDLFVMVDLYHGDVEQNGYTFRLSVQAYASGEEDGVVIEMRFGNDSSDPIDLQGAEQFGRNYAEALDVMRRANQELARLAATQTAA